MTERQCDKEKILEWLKKQRYLYYDDSEAKKKKIDELFKHKVFNCSDWER